LQKGKVGGGVDRHATAGRKPTAVTGTLLSRNARGAETTKAPQPKPYFPYRNKLEFSFAQLLVIEKHANLIRDWTYESMTLKLSTAAPGKRGDYHRIDFLIWHLDGSIELAQTKGWHRNLSASLKGLRWAAQKNPWFRFTIRRFRNGWHTERVEA
jgi:hypothetical protein